MANEAETIYRISTSPFTKRNLLVNPKYLEDNNGNVALITIPNDCIQTGMYNKIEDLKLAMLNAKFIFTLGDLDETSYLELGIACSLGKKIYFVSNNDTLSIEKLNLFVRDIDLIFISPKKFISLLG